MIGAYPQNAIISPMTKQVLQSTSLSVTAHKIIDNSNNVVPAMQKIMFPPLLLTELTNQFSKEYTDICHMLHAPAPAKELCKRPPT